MSKVRTGAELLVEGGFKALGGQAIGLITNHTGRAGNELLLDVMARSRGARLAAILTPEHGLRGTAEAGAKVSGSIDRATGVPVHSLYGANLKPTPAMLAGLGLVVFDMQDIGTRFYTYISTMGLAMQAAAAAGLPFIVLDRPNPLGGVYASGFVLEPAFASFVGRYPIPIAHGLTTGELARMIKGERLLPGLDKLELLVVRLDGWRRDMLWPATGLEWVATSPNIPTFETALAYAGTGLFEASVASEGRGTQAPFLLLGHPAIKADALAGKLNQAALPGVRFSATVFTPRAIANVASKPRFKGRRVAGIRLAITDPNVYQPVETGVHILAGFAEALRAAGRKRIASNARAFNRLAGTDRLLAMLGRGMPAGEIAALWREDVQRYMTRRSPYLLYR